MNTIKKIDDIGRIAIPKDLRRALRWMGGDEIEIISNPDDSITLRKYQPNFADKMREVKNAFSEWAEANDISLSDENEQKFLDLIDEIQEKEKLT